MPEIQAVSHKHEAILNHLIANPTMSLGTVAIVFGYTQAWLSCIIHSDAFQERLKERQDLAFHHTILPITEKMQVVAHAALDRLVETIPLETEAKNLSGIAADVLDRLGFGAPKQGGISLTLNQQNNVHVSTLAEEIRSAQALLGRGPPPVEVAKNGDLTVIALPATSNGADKEVQIQGVAGLGKAHNGSALLGTSGPDPGPETGSAIREEGALEAGGAV